jgi:hypothetical protein
LEPSGFVIANISQPSFNTTTSSADTTLNIQPAELDPSLLTFKGSQGLRGGLAAVTVNITSSNTSVGTITVSPVTFNVGDTQQTTSFHPVASGTSVIQVTAPGFSTASDHNNITANVN